jgi:hypothetical protein
MKGHFSAVLLLTIVLVAGSIQFSVLNCHAWSNGGFSDDPNTPDYGTHDWIAQHALDWVPYAEKQYISGNLAAYLYGTELPDNRQASDGIGDTSLHHVYFNSSKELTDDAAARRAASEFNNTLGKLEAQDYKGAAENAGIMTHYIADLAVFAHVMGATTDWGKEANHSLFEDSANGYTSSYDSAFTRYLVYDGSLVEIPAYRAAVMLAYETTFDNMTYTAVWMDQHYSWNDLRFMDRVGELLNLAVNYIADVLHTLSVQAGLSGSPPISLPGSPLPVPLWFVGVAVAVVAVLAVIGLMRGRPRRSRGKLVRLSNPVFNDTSSLLRCTKRYFS